MKKNKKIVLSLLSIVMIVFSCKKVDRQDETSIMTVPDGFNYSTTTTVDLNVRLLTHNNLPLAGVLVSVYNSDNIEKGAELTKIISDKDGYVKASLVLPSYTENLVIDPAYIGLIRNAHVKISSNKVNLTLGGDKGFIGDLFVPQPTLSQTNSLSKQSNSSISATATVYDYNQSKFDNLGRPLNLEGPDNSVNFVELLQHVNAALPERKDGIFLHPEYIATEAPSNLSVTRLSDIWITFVHEGADYRNSLGYYTYPTGHKPTRAADIDTVHLIFPNASLLGHTGAGNMHLGDKVKIGRFPAGTSIGFVLIQKGYNADKSLTTNGVKFYSDEEFNTEADFALKRHNVLLNSRSQKVFLVGFEDIRRDIGLCDNDFNDLIFFAQSNPVNAIDPTDIPYLEERVEDTDGDGVPDINDEYPNDPERAYNRYYPSKTIWGTLAFEDQWPSQGDYDLNDLVVSYRYKFVMNSDNKILDIVSEFKPLAAGAVFQNGLGVEIPQRANTVKKVIGHKITGNYISLNSIGLENGHTNAVIIPFDNNKSLFRYTPAYINTLNSAAKIVSDTVKVSMTFLSPQYDAFTAKVPFNPFLISNANRGKEVHLVNQAPTNLADRNLLGTGHDNSNPSMLSYYITVDKKPFALNFTSPFNYPLEKTSIYEAYPHFSEWAESGGSRYKDWYLNKAGYRNSSKIYSK